MSFLYSTVIHPIKPKSKDLIKEIIFQTSRSSGPGGQHVNKVNTKVMLLFHVSNSQLLNDDQKAVIHERMSSRINKEGLLSITSQNKRSQLQNKEETIKKFDKLLTKAFAIKKVRKPSKPSKSAINKRLEDKKRQSEKKRFRKGFE